MLKQLYRIACYNTLTNELVGYWSYDGDITEDPDEIVYYGTSEAAGAEIDTCDEESTNIRKEVELVEMSLTEFMTQH